jgi:ribosomal protein L13
MKSFMANPSNIERKWFVVDAADKTLGRMPKLQKSFVANTNRLLLRIWIPEIM